MTTITVPIKLTINGVLVPSSMTLDPSLLLPMPPAPTNLKAIPGDHIVTLSWT